MGCGQSNLEEKEPEEDTASKNTEPIPEEQIQLTEHQKYLLQETWRLVNKDAERIGSLALVSLFIAHPEIQDDFFPFKDKTLEEVKGSNRLRTHAVNVMQGVGQVLARLDEPRKMQAMLQTLGKTHAAFGLDLNNFNWLPPHFIQTFKSELKEKCTVETEQAWSDFFKMMAGFMKEGISIGESA